MQLKIIKKIKIVNTVSVSTADLTENISVDLTQFFQKQKYITALMKILDNFRTQVKLIRKSVILTSSINYLI
ncbi:hypothetical protein EMPG_13937 [Blastomyces silverae]|uniref:Uncharacterized protein n=1 Tax=Blastomyces silverae TaxID=2060906 RepID=A0A0H1BGP3_9EURO|nr:hypothetical protein EMPG_13937 [Blastomyces silverae]